MLNFYCFITILNASSAPVNSPEPRIFFQRKINHEVFKRTIYNNGNMFDAVDFCIGKLKNGEWLHIFPEGRVNVNKEFIRFKWGIGRIIYELPVTPIIIPIWHIGMEDILPNTLPYYFRIGKVITLNFGPPIEISDLVKQLKYDKVNPQTARLKITNHIQEKMLLLKAQTEKLIVKKHSN